MYWKKLREDNNISMKKACSSLGISEEKLRRIENGEEEPSQLLADRIVDLYFFSGSPTKQAQDDSTPINIRHLRHNPITCSTCGSRDIAYVAETHRSIFLRFFSLIFLGICVWLISKAIITLLGNPEADVSISFGFGGICFIVFLCFQISVFFSEARSHVKCVCKDCGDVWLHD